MCSEMYPYAGKTTLKWATRRTTILAELQVYDPDVLCLQECDHFADVWQPALAQLGYDGVLQTRPANKPDGCAVFWRRARFDLADRAEIQYNDAANSVPTFVTHNVGLLVRLVPRDGTAGGRPFVVANHHLYYRQWYNYLRLRQMCHFARRLAVFNGIQQHPVVFCGGTYPDVDESL